MRAVFDTNVVISALIFGRRLAWLRQAWTAGSVTPFVCRETVAELLRVLAYPKFRLDADDRETLLADYLPFAEIAQLPSPLPELPLACRDRDDAISLQLAIASRAALLISGDADLTVLAAAYADLTVLAAAYKVASPAMLHLRLRKDTA